MTTTDALLAAVLASPDDDLPRLVYADWCEENGDPDRGEFIRVQIERAKGHAPGLAVREQVLLHAHGERWFHPLRRPGGPLATRRCHAVFRRGFVEAVWMPAAWFVRQAEVLFAACPVVELRAAFDGVREFDLLREWPFARLRTLDVCDQRFGTNGVAVLRGCPHLRGWTVLRLPGCNIGDAAAGLLPVAGWHPHLLDLRHNPLSPPARTALRAHFGPAVLFG